MRIKPVFLIFIFCFLFSLQASGAKKSKSQSTYTNVIISDTVVTALENKDLEKAAILLRDHPTSNKSIYLLRQATRILLHENNDIKPERNKAHRYYKNIAIAYHNLFLFLKSCNATQTDYFKKALKYYKKSNRGALSKQKQEIQILVAALYATNGDLNKANKLFKKYNKEKYGPDIQLYLSLASYYAAIGNVEDTIMALKAAYRESSETVMNWMAVGDDFYLIRNDPQFRKLMQGWHISKRNKKPMFSVPSKQPLKLKYSTPPLGYHSSKNP